MTKKYSWKRFWCPRDKAFNLGDQGFLIDPDEEYGQILNPHLVSSEQLLQQQCLVLLGEPGIGKSHEIKEIHRKIKSEQNPAIFIDLRSYGEESRLCSAIFESQEFKNLTNNGSSQMYLFLDSLDECLLRIRNIASLLTDELSKRYVRGLVLIIASRTAEWPNSLEQSLTTLYGGDNVKVYELVPLRRKDIISTAEAENINADGFLDILIKKNAVPLGIKPVTLQILVNLFKKDGSFPSSQTELYEKGCVLMCEEPDEHRRGATAKNNISADILLSVASRIAAVTMFSNRYAVWTDVDSGNNPPEDVTIKQLTGGKETANGQTIIVSEYLVKHALATGLFTSRGPHRMGWAHQTYAEFLAARYLTQSGMNKKKKMSLLIHPSDIQQKLVPQLYETAAWVANMNNDVFNEIMEIEPELLLRSDIASVEADSRKRLVGSLLTSFDQEELLDRETYKYYYKLDYPSLADQLKPYVINKNKGFLVRRVAIDIAEACKSKDLLPALTQVALDPDDDMSVRINAACAIARIGDSDSKDKLRTILFQQIEDDQEDRLKGWVLQACWPEHISIEELFQVIKPAKNPNHVGSYEQFLYELPEKLSVHLKPEDLKYALGWISSTHNVDWNFNPRWEKIRDWIIQESWENLLKVPGLIEPFAKAIFSFMQRYDDAVSREKKEEFNKRFLQDLEKRRLVTNAILPLFADQIQNVHLLLTLYPLITENDYKWMLEQYDSSSDEIATYWYKLIGYFYQSAFPWNFTWLLSLRRSHRLVAILLSYLFKPLGVFYRAFFIIKAFYWRRKYLLRKNDKQPVLKPPPKERVLILLDRFQKGDPNAWWKLNSEMTLEPNSRYYRDEFEPDLTQLPVWRELDTGTHSRLIEAAKKYVLHPPKLDKSWIGTNTFNRPFMAGYRALVLLLDKDPQFIDHLPDNSWKTWAPIFIAYELNSGVDEEPHTLLIKKAYQHAPEAIIETLLAIIDEENSRHDHIFITRRIEHCLNERLANALFDKVKSGALKPNCKGELFDLLFKNNYKPAIDYAKSQIESTLPSKEPDCKSVLVIAESLFANQPAVGWEVIKPIIEDNTDFGKKVFERSVRLYRHDEIGLFAQNLNEIQIGDIYIWLTKQYPYEEDPQIQGAHEIGPRENITFFRNDLLQYLKMKGTPESYQQLKRIASELSQLNWMKWVIIEASKNLRAKSWKPLTAEQIIKLVQNHQLTFVETSTQLLDVICESLRHLEQKLHGEMPAIDDLWENRGNSRNPQYCPKDESHLSDYVARHLSDNLGRQRGIIVNREVQIRRGQYTDIHIDAINPATDNRGIDIIKCIIEVKGCWNPELETAMKTQLVDGYLQDHQCPNGIYLVGWFMCEQWNVDVDYRKKGTPTMQLEEARTSFADQAVTLIRESKIPSLILKSYVLDTTLK